MHNNITEVREDIKQGEAIKKSVKYKIIFLSITMVYTLYIKKNRIV